MIKRQNPSSVWHTVSSINNECFFVRPHTTCVNSCGAQEEPGSWKVGPCPLFSEANPDFWQVRVQGPEPGREKTGSWQFSSRTEQVEPLLQPLRPFCEHICCQIGGQI